MIRSCLIILALASSTASTAQPAATVTVNVEGFKPANGSLVVSLCTQQQFAKRDCPAVEKGQKPGQATFVFGNILPGRYAASVYQDANGNGRLDLDLLGRPAEPAAMSGSQSLIPNFDKAAFTVGGNAVTVPVRLK